MPSTSPDSLVYPDSSGSVNLWTHFQNLADSVQTKFAAYETWSNWTLTWGGLGGITSVGAGFIDAFYQRIGKLVHAQFRIELGAGFTFSGTELELQLPVTSYSSWSGAGNQATLGSWVVRDDSLTNHYAGSLGQGGAGGTTCHFDGAWNGTAPQKRVTGSTNIPITWAAGDIISGVLHYRSS